MISELDGVLHADVEQNQRPRGGILVLKALPVQPGALSDVVEQIHVHEQGNVIAQTVAAVHVDVKRGEIPDLNDGEGAHDIHQKHRAADESVFDVVQQGVVAPDDIDKDQIVDQLQILDLFFFSQIHGKTSGKVVFPTIPSFPGGVKHAVASARRPA